MVQRILGEGCGSVESMGADLYDVLRLNYSSPSGGVQAILFNARGKVGSRQVTAVNYHHCAYQATAYGAGGAIHAPVVDDFLFLHSALPIVRMAKRMALTRKPPIPYASMLELMEMIEAGRLAHNRRKPVSLESLRSR
jgi:hypothetical protein